MTTDHFVCLLTPHVSEMKLCGPDIQCHNQVMTSVQSLFYLGAVGDTISPYCGNKDHACLLATATTTDKNNTFMHHLTTGIRSEKCVVRRFCRANVAECTFTNLDNIV